MCFAILFSSHSFGALWNNELSEFRVGSENTMIPNEVVTRSGYQRCKLAKKIQGRKQDMVYFGLFIPNSNEMSVQIGPKRQPQSRGSNGFGGRILFRLAGSYIVIND